MLLLLPLSQKGFVRKLGQFGSSNRSGSCNGCHGLGVILLLGVFHISICRALLMKFCFAFFKSLHLERQRLGTEKRL